MTFWYLKNWSVSSGEDWGQATGGVSKAPALAWCPWGTWAWPCSLRSSPGVTMRTCCKNEHQQSGMRALPACTLPCLELRFWSLDVVLPTPLHHALGKRAFRECLTKLVANHLPCSKMHSSFLQRKNVSYLLVVPSHFLTMGASLHEWTQFIQSLGGRDTESLRVYWKIYLNIVIFEYLEQS